MGAAMHGHDEPIVGINVTPLVDITLVLLVIFMVTAKVLISRSLPMDLPTAAAPGETQLVFAVTVDADGRAHVGEAFYDSDDDLRNAAAGALAKEPNLRAVIQASRAAPHGTVIRVLDDLQQGGVRRVAFAVDPKPKGAER